MDETIVIQTGNMANEDKQVNISYVGTMKRLKSDITAIETEMAALDKRKIVKKNTLARIEQEFANIQVAPPPPPSPTGKYIMLNATNWTEAGLNVTPLLPDTSEVTYFVLPVSAAGALLNTNQALEDEFVADVHAGGKKATFSIAGGAQNVADITAAVTTNRTAFINNIGTHLTARDYDGVIVDIENTNINAQAMADFFIALRTKLDTIQPNLILGAYTQPYQLNTVWAQIGQAASGITWMSAMIYDYNYTMAELKSQTLAWLPRVGNDRSKLLCGVAVNYATGLNTTQFGEVLDWVSSENLKGVGIWESRLYTQPWIDVRRTKWTTLA